MRSIQKRRGIQYTSMKAGRGPWHGLGLSRDPDYADRTQTNINGVQIAELIGSREICTIVSLGPGLGNVDAEVAANLKSTKLREYVPVDVNRYFLLHSARRVAAQNPAVECKCAIQCDFDMDASYVGTVILDHCPGPRLFLMAGGTFGNSRRSVSAQLGALFDIMDKGDTFTFDLFCHGPSYDPHNDPLKDRSQWPAAVEAFFVSGIRQLSGKSLLSASRARQRIYAKETVGNSGLAKTTTISVVNQHTGQSLLDIRRFDFAEIRSAIGKAGFAIRENSQGFCGAS